MAAFITVLILLGALLVLDNTVFGLFTFTIYFYVIRFLIWPWRLLGAAAVGLLAGTSQAYGVNKETLTGALIYLIIVAVNVAIGLAFTWSRWNTECAVGKLSEANGRLEATLAENAGLQQQLLTQAREAGVVDERQRMAREIHDTLAQGLTGIITQLQAAEQAADDPAGWHRHFDAATGLARESLSEARRSVEALRPESLETGPAERGAGRRGRPLVGPAPDPGPGHHDRNGPADAAPGRVRAAPDRSGGAGQRGQARAGHPGRGHAVLHGARGRAGRARRRPRLRPGPALRRGRPYAMSAGLVGLSVADGLRPTADGLRPAASQPHDGGFGLVAMRQRIESLAGTLQVESEPGFGTGISACLPVAQAAS